MFQRTAEVDSILRNSELLNAAKLVDEMRTELSAELLDAAQHRDLIGDPRLLRFLEGYSGVTNDAVAAFRRMLQWRKDNDLERIRSEVQDRPYTPENLPHGKMILVQISRASGGDAPIMNAGVSHSGHLISCELIGSGDPSALLEGTTEQELRENVLGFFERRQILLDDLSYTSGHLVKTFQVRDLSRFGLHLLKHRRAAGTLQALMKSALDNYPESLAQCVIVASPATFQVTWKTLSWFINRRTHAKILFEGADYHERLLAQIPRRRWRASTS